MSIPKLLTSTYVAETDTVTKQILAAYETSGLTIDTHLSAIVSTLSPLSNQMNIALGRSNAESILDEHDILRDDAFRAVYYLVGGLSYHSDGAIATAAKEVAELFEPQGLGVIKESYAVESAYIEALITRLNESAVIEKLQLIPGASMAVAVLTEAQIAFAAASVSYEEQKASDKTALSATALKHDIFSVINGKLVVYLRAMILVDEPTFGVFGGTVAQIIRSNNSDVKRR